MNQAFIVTKEHRRFTEFANAVRKEKTIGICHGAAGVGKANSARRYANWDALEPYVNEWGPRGDHDAKHYALANRSRTVFYTPEVLCRPKDLMNELMHWQIKVGICAHEHLRSLSPEAAAEKQHDVTRFVELLIIVEAERLTPTALELLRDHRSWVSRDSAVLISFRISRLPWQLRLREKRCKYWPPVSIAVSVHGEGVCLVPAADFTVVLVHGAFAESAMWNGVIPLLQAADIAVNAFANPLRSLRGDTEHLRHVIASAGSPVILVGHSYGGMVITEAASGNANVAGLVYVAAFAPETGESASALTVSRPGSTLASSMIPSTIGNGQTELRIDSSRFHEQFAADLGPRRAALLAATQRPVAEKALTDPLEAAVPAWLTVPSWHVFGSHDRYIPRAVHLDAAERARSHGTAEVVGASHAIALSQPAAVAITIQGAVAELRSSRR